jgi:DNA-binding NarL/FixJ family response regulator
VIVVAAQTETSSTTTRVLLVEDDRMFAELLQLTLEEHDDIEVAGWATNGVEALALVEAKAPDVVVLDYRLPGDDGISVATRVREAAPDVALLMLTGRGDDAVLRAAVGAGCSGFVTKDQAVVDLVRAIYAVRDGVAAFDVQHVASLAAPVNRDAVRGPSTLTERELEVLQMLADGLSTKRVAEQLFISVNTARNHVQRVIRKLDAHSRLEAVALARRAGLLGEPRS